MKLRFAFTSLLVSAALFSFANPPEEGISIFKARCSSCHNIHKIMTGPALAGVDNRHNLEWIISFVHSSQTLVKNGDKDAVALYEKFNRVVMPDHPDLTNDDIKNVINYIKEESKKTISEKIPFVKKVKPDTIYYPLSIRKSPMLIAGYFACVLLLILTLTFVVRFKEMRVKQYHEA